MSHESCETEEPPAAGAPAWMTTFADMMSLLLCFFVLLLSFATIDIIKFRDMLGSLDEAFGVRRVDPGPWNAATRVPIELSGDDTLVELPAEPGARVDRREQDREFARGMRELLERGGRQGLVRSVSSDRGLILRIQGSFMFESGSGEIRLGAMALLDELADLAKSSDYMISVEGHTDDVPIHSAQFPTNWHLSTARAVAGVLYLTGPGELDPARLRATGFAHTRPIAWGHSAEARAENRRMEIVFTSPSSAR